MCPLMFSRTTSTQDLLTQAPISRGDTHVAQYGEGTANKQVTFHDPVRNSDMDDEDAEGNPNEREIPTNWSSGNPPYTTTLEDPSSSFSPFLPPVLEEPSSSFSEGNGFYCLKSFILVAFIGSPREVLTKYCWLL